MTKSLTIPICVLENVKVVGELNVFVKTCALEKLTSVDKAALVVNSVPSLP